MSSKKSAILAGVSTVSVAALIVAKMYVFNWAGRKLQDKVSR